MIHYYIIPLHHAYMEYISFIKNGQVISYLARTVDYKFVVWG